MQTEFLVELSVHLTRADNAAPERAQPGHQFGEHGSRLPWLR